MQLDQGSAVDRYVVEGLIGQGGVASVYRVRHTGLGTVHALKVVHVPSAAVTERLLREGRIQGRLRHPNVISVTDLISIKGAPGLVMEYVPGPSLEEFLARGRLTLDEADAIARGILAGVAAAHRVGLIHRDLKPGNVLIDVTDSQIVPRIVDFGLAKLLDPDEGSPLATRAGATLGTPAYMAPEQIDDASAVDERADVFALGAILFELVAGERAFAGDTVSTVYSAIRSGTHRPIPEGVPGRMARAITGALVRDPSERIPTVDALIQAWTADAPLTSIEWSHGTLERAKVVQPLVRTHTEKTPSSSTFAGENRTTQETWADPGLARTRPELAVEPRGERRARWALAAVLGALGLALAVGYWARPRPIQALGPDAVPVISADPAVQRQFESAWSDFLAADFAQSERRLRSVREAEPEAILPPTLASGALLLLGDVPAGLEAMSDARGLVASGAVGPGRDLAMLFEEIQKNGGQDTPAMLLAHSEAHPDDYLARLLAALHCSMSSRVEDCERAHARLLEVEGEHVAATLCMTRSWMDLGELERARATASEGLRIDPRQPALLSMVGGTWLAEGEEARARESLEAALQADPTLKDAKIALAQVSLIEDDGDFDRITTELLAPTVPPSDRVNVHTEAAETLLGLGRAREALEHLERARAIEEAEGTPLGVLTAMSHRASVYTLQGRLDLLQGLVSEQIALVSVSPEIPNPVRNRYATYGPWAEGLVAAKRGDRPAVERALARTRASEVRQIGTEEGLARALAAMDRDEEGIRAAATFFWTDCDRHGTLGNVFDEAGMPEQARAEWEAVLSSPCRLHRTERARAVTARIGLAELEAAAGRVDRARALLAEVDELWPRPDPDLPVVERLERVRARLGEEG